MNDKVKINVGTIGHVDHGRTTLAAALMRVLDEQSVAEDDFQIVVRPHHEELLRATIKPPSTRGPKFKRGKGNKYR